MREQRRHQRIRFHHQPSVRIGQYGMGGTGGLENLSLGGLMLRTELPLKVGEVCGCEFAVLDASLIDVSAVVVSKIGDLHGIRFQAGPVSESLIKEAMDYALACGKASVLTINELQGRKVMRIVGGLNAGLYNDFVHSLTRMGVDRLDLSEVTWIDTVGLELCRIAMDQYQAEILAASDCVNVALNGARVPVKN